MMVRNGMDLAALTHRAIELGLDKGRRAFHTIMASSPPPRRVWRGRAGGFTPLWIAAGLLAGTAIVLVAWRWRTSHAADQDMTSETATHASPHPAHGKAA